MKSIKVTLQSGRAFLVDNGRHSFISDQPVSGGGNDEGPSPVELFVASLVSCVGVFAQIYLDRHGIPYSDLEVSGEYSMVPAPNRVGQVEIAVSGIEGLADEERESLLVFVKKCTVHNSLFQPPVINIAVEPAMEVEKE